MDKVGPVKLAYTEFDPVGGADPNLPPIIYLHGITCTKEVWDEIPQVVANRTKRKAYALDARNHGDSEYTEVYNFDLNVVDLFHFMDAMKIQKAILVGHSMGGLTSEVAAIKAPERVEMVFSEDMYANFLPKSLTDACLEYAKLLDEAVQSIPRHMNEIDGAKFVVDVMYSKLSEGQPFYSKKEDMYKEKLAFRRRPDGGYGVKFNKDAIFRALSDVENLMSEFRGQYNGPAFYLYGSISPLEVYKEEDNIKRLFPKAVLIEYKDATHNVHIEFPNKFINDLILHINQK